MTSLIADEGIEFLKITQFARGDSTTTQEFYVGLHYYAANTIYSGSPEIFPALAEPINGPRLALQPYAAGVKNAFTIRLRAYSGFDIATSGPASYLEDWEYHGATVECYYIPRALSGDLATFSSSVNLRQSLQCVGWDLDNDEDELKISVRESWFKDRRLGRSISEDNLGITGYNFQSNATGVAGQVAFGSDVVIDALKLDKVTGIANDPLIVLFDGWKVSATFANREVKHIYASTTNVALNNRGSQRWFLLDTDFDTGSHLSSYRNTNDSFAGFYAAAPAQYNSLNSNNYGQDFQPTQNHLMVGVELFLRKDGTVPYDFGEMKVNVYEYQDVASGLTSTRILASASTDPAAVSSSGAKVGFVFDQPVMLVGGQKYFFEYAWSRDDDATNELRIGVNLASASFLQDKSVDEAGWTNTSSIVPISYFWALDTNAVSFALSTNFVEMIQFGPPTGFQNDLVTDENVRYKAIVDGIEDDSSGTITGTANLLLDEPAYMQLAVMLGDIGNGFGLGLSTSDIDISSFRSAANSQSNAVLRLSFAYSGGQTAEQFLVELSYYGLNWIYRARDGRISSMLRGYTSTPDHDFDHSFIGECLEVVDVRSLPHSSVINVLKQEYSAEYLEVVDDARRSLIENSEQLKSESVIDENDATYGVQSQESQDLYGRREHTKPLPYLQSQTAVDVIQEYYFKRFNTPPEEVTVTFPRIWYFDSFDLLDVFQVTSPKLGANGGDNVDQLGLAGSSVTTYQDGIPYAQQSSRTVQGEVMLIGENDLDVVIGYQTRGDYS